MACLNDELATKTAEITILRSRLQAFERENTRLENELATARDAGPASKQSQQRQVELERVHGELQYARQDLISSEDERKRLKLTVQKMQQEMDHLKAQPVVEKPVPMALPPEEPRPAPKPRPEPSGPSRNEHNVASADRPLQEHRSCDDPMNEDTMRQHIAILLGLAERWDGQIKQRLTLQAGVTNFPNKAQSAADAAVELLQEGLHRRQWCALTAGSIFLKHWFGLFPLHASEIAASAAQEAKSALFGALAAVLHSAVLDPATTQCEEEEALEREACAIEVLAALQEIASKLSGALLTALSPVLQQPSLLALLCEDPAPDTLHLQTLRLLEALMGSPDLFTLAHQAETDENVLLAVANALLIPSIPPQRQKKLEAPCEDTVSHQNCRVAALELLLRCLATAPSPDFVLQLRGAAEGEEVDTVLQRVVLLCHHELLCMKLGARSEQRTKAAELSLFILSSWLWHAVPQPLSLSPQESRELCLKQCDQLGRTRILLESVVEMVQTLGADECFKSFLSSTSALRMIIPFVDGEEGAPPSGAASSGSATRTRSKDGPSAAVMVT